MSLSIGGISVRVVIGMCVAFGAFSDYVSAQEACFECHGDPEITAKDGGARSLFVDPTLYNDSVHGDLACEDCHADVEEIPHAGRLEKVACAECHDDAAAEYAGSVHSAAAEGGAASCVDCHGKHDILSPSDALARTHPLNVPATCAKCHADPKVVKKHEIPAHDPLAAYKKSVHGIALLLKKNLAAPNCVSCHGSHKILPLSDSYSPIYWTHVGETCGRCHSEIYQEYRQSVHGVARRVGCAMPLSAPTATVNMTLNHHGIQNQPFTDYGLRRKRVSAATLQR